MRMIENAVKQPITVMVAVVLSVMSGILAFSRVPVQMTPTVDSVVIAVDTFWENASPMQVESDIVTEQEKVLSDLTGLTSMTSTSRAGAGSLRLEFESGTDINEAMQKVLQKLDEVPAYPDGVSQPLVKDSDPDSQEKIAWVGLASTDQNFDPTTLHTFIDKRLIPRFERLKGITNVQILGAREKELQVQVNPSAMASYGITYSMLVAAIESNNQNYSGGKLVDGKNDIRVKAIGRFDSPDSLKNLVLRRDEAGSVLLGDVAHVTEGYKELTTWARARGILMPFLNFELQHGANLLQAAQALQEEIKVMNAPGGILEQEAKRLGLNGTLELVQTWDESTYVDDAIDLVQSNILIGSLLATLTLLLFLRSFRTIGVIALAIPISVIAAVVILVLLGRSINIISLAGMAFAVGMVIDNAIVVIENIFRHLEMGKSSRQASIDGTKEVGGAVFASTLTTIAVFFPILFIQDTTGQLFKDISLAIMAAVGISFLVSIFVIPAAAAGFLRLPSRGNPSEKDNLINRIPHIVSQLVSKLIKTWPRRLAVVSGFLAITMIGIIVLIPPMDYLPKGNKSGVFGMLFTPPGYNSDKIRDLSIRLEDTIRPAWEYTGDKFALESTLRGSSAPTEDNRPMLTIDGQQQKAPGIDHYFVVAMNGMLLHVGIPDKEGAPIDTVDLLNLAANGANVPDVISFAFQFPLFQTGGHTGSAISIDLTGDDLTQVTNGASALFFKLMETYGPYATMPNPANFLLPTPELKVTPNDDHLRRANLNRSDLGMAVAINGDGLVLFRDYAMDGELKDIKIISQDSFGEQPLDAMMRSPLATPEGNIIDFSHVADLERIRVPEQIRHVARQRAITLQFTPPEGMPLDDAIGGLKNLVKDLRSAGAIDPSIDVNLSGSAGKLNEVKEALLGDGSTMGLVSSSMFLAFVVVYLVMVILFQNWFYPLVIMVTVPLATLGGFLGLSGVHMASVIDRYVPVQNLDVLTILGFVILAGVVVNNAILIVHQTLNFLQGKSDTGETMTQLSPKDAIVQSVKSRVRPILMSTLTSIGGMLPLVLMPGAGSELYRGLGAVVVGGLLVATVFTMILVPVILSIIFDLRGQKQQGEQTQLERDHQVA
ncbi:efflux RND transporter permease subunit [Algicola sagamiensis]|uniref:efflux RND transporter permease subunit n=1 Tax=Algicola sagamiensis TaxID=163869 RepID=UPI00035F186B|nr:efflux RND transporter permease subunit [Algicola sagamiensis]